MPASSAHWNHIFRNGASMSHCVEHPVSSDLYFFFFLRYSIIWLLLLAFLISFHFRTINRESAKFAVLFIDLISFHKVNKERCQ